MHVERDGDVVKIRNLYDTHSKSLKVVVAHSSMHVSVGNELIVGPHPHALLLSVKSDGIGRRSVRDLQLPEGHTLMRSEISMTSFLQNSPLFSKLIQSDDVLDAAIMEKLMKMAACVSLVSGPHGAYSQVSGK